MKGMGSSVLLRGLKQGQREYGPVNGLALSTRALSCVRTKEGL